MASMSKPIKFDPSYLSLTYSDTSEASPFANERVTFPLPSVRKPEVDNSSTTASTCTSLSSFSLPFCTPTTSLHSSTTILSSSSVSKPWYPTYNPEPAVSEPAATDNPKAKGPTHETRSQRTYTRPIINPSIKPETSIKIVSSRERDPSSQRRPRQRTKMRQKSSIDRSRTLINGLVLPKNHYIVWSRFDPPMSPHMNPLCDGPDPRNLPHPIPDIIVSDFALLLGAAHRYASSPLAQKQTRPCHNIVDPTLLGRYNGGVRVGFPVAKCRAWGHEMVDVSRFRERGGQESVAVLGVKRVVQWRVVGRGCPSGCCGCKGRGVTMAGCGDLKEEGNGEDCRKESTDAYSELAGRTKRTMPVMDRIEGARRMRMRLERRKVEREVLSRPSSEREVESEQNLVGRGAATTSETDTHQTKTVRRRKSKFVEVGCSLGDDSVETLATPPGTPRNSEEPSVRGPVSGSNDSQEVKEPAPLVEKKSKRARMKKFLRM